MFEGKNGLFGLRLRRVRQEGKHTHTHTPHWGGRPWLTSRAEQLVLVKMWSAVDCNHFSGVAGIAEPPLRLHELSALPVKNTGNAHASANERSQQKNTHIPPTRQSMT